VLSSDAIVSEVIDMAGGELPSLVLDATGSRTPARTAVPALLRLSPADNVLIVASGLSAGDVVVVGDERVTLPHEVPLGHKLAAAAIAQGEPVIRAGVPIGSATAAIAPGEWVHTHNLKSDYIKTFAHRGGEDA
jgi:hypothetical protein